MKFKSAIICTGLIKIKNLTLISDIIFYHSRRLYLQDNQISDIGRGTFSAVTRIGTVDLARNNITKVDYQMFQQVKYAEVSVGGRETG